MSVSSLAPTTSVPLTLRAVTGVPLTIAQGDGNLTALAAALALTAQAAPTQAAIAALQQSTQAALANTAPATVVNRANQVGYDPGNLVNQNTANRTLIQTDALPNSTIETNFATANTVTVPLNTAVAAVPPNRTTPGFQVDDTIYIYVAGTGATTIVAAAGVQIVVPTGYSMQALGQGSELKLRNRGVNLWALTGNLATTAQAGGGTGTGPQPPANTGAPIITGSTQYGSTLSIGTAAVWTNSPTITRQWFANGVAISGVTGSTYVTTLAEVGQGITYQETGTVSGLAPVTGIMSNSITVTNSAVTTPTPIAGSPPSASGTFAVSNALALSAGGWNGSPTLYTFTPYINGVAQTPIGPQASASASYTLGTSAAGTAFSFTVLAANGSGNDAAGPISSATYNIPGAAPVLTASSTVAIYDVTNSGGFYTGDTLALELGVWANNPTYAYAWYSASAKGIKTLVGSLSTYVIQSSDVGCMISCVVTGTSTGGPIPEEALGVGPCQASSLLPVWSVQPSLSPTSASVGGVITASVGTVSNSPTISYQWLRNGSVNIGTNSATYTIVAADAGSTITCLLAGVASGLTATALTSNSCAVSGSGGGSLSATVTSNAGNSNLTTLFPLGWKTWPNTTTSNNMSGGLTITETQVNMVAQTNFQYGQNYTNGTSPTSATGCYGIITTWGEATGAGGNTLSIPLSGTATRVSGIIVGAYNQGYQIVASLSDNSAAPITVGPTYTASNSTVLSDGNNLDLVTFTCNAASSGQSLNLAVTNAQGSLGAGQILILAVGIES